MQADAGMEEQMDKKLVVAVCCLGVFATTLTHARQYRTGLLYEDLTKLLPSTR